ncbi:uncharacterized protein LOC119765153 isoform X2 [Culex quinquefasciatus]|uniref:uncharacterized protein LOC119765153 isoform X2 n=1 Tax=Culex quinquefasciatus TaxID=7176 RepID=UPI0018E39590|nr:uncharacterized protein LOC119765153 isoform X2 [Culex quinquefasciatus]
MLRDKMFWFGLDCRYHSNIKACEIKLNAFENLERAMEYIVNFLCFVLVIVPQITCTEECIDPKDKQLESCCNVPELFPTVTTRNCHLRARNMTTKEDTLGYLSCFHECVSNESGAITAGSTVNVDRYYQMAGLFNEAIKHTYRMAVDRCVEMPRRASDQRTACDIFALNFNGCIIHMVALYCPKEVASTESTALVFRSVVSRKRLNEINVKFKNPRSVFYIS